VRHRLGAYPSGGAAILGIVRPVNGRLISGRAIGAVCLAALFWLNRSLRDPNAGGPVVPDVTGMTLAKANETLRATNLLPGTIEAKQSARPVGTVLEQSVDAGTIAPATSAVSLLVSAGPHPEPDERKVVAVGGECDVMPSPPAGQPCTGPPLYALLVTSPVFISSATLSPSVSATATPSAAS
jgi:PASTA domain